jgi:hypothetical protein
MDTHFDSVVAKVGTEIEKNGSLLDLLAGAIFDDGGCLWKELRRMKVAMKEEERWRTMESNKAAFSLQPIW